MPQIKQGGKPKNKFLYRTVLAIMLILSIAATGAYFKNLIEKERTAIWEELREALLQAQKEAGTEIFLEAEQVSPLTLSRLRESGIERFFLSEVELAGAYYNPVINACLYDKGRPVYPLYLYETSSLLVYPDPNPEVALIRYLLLPDDNQDFQPNQNCYIKEIVTENDWREVENKYNFSRNRF